MDIFENREITEDYEKQLCGICGENHYYKNCTYVEINLHICDKKVPSKARLSLPDALEIRKLADDTNSIFAKEIIKVGTQFGPFEAKKLFTLNPQICFPLKIFTKQEADFSEYFLDTTDENECSWMIFINAANDFEEQNMICFQDGEHLYYSTIRDIYPGESLKVWYSPYYAFKMKRQTLTFNTFSNILDENKRKNGPNINDLIKQQQKIIPRDVWNCKFCYQLEKNVADFAGHLLAHYKAHLKKMCEICKQTFLFRKDLKKHMKLFHHNRVIAIGHEEPRKGTENTKVLLNSTTLEMKDNPVGGPLLLNNLLSDSLENSDLALHKNNLENFEIENENENLLENDNLNLSVDGILNHNVKYLDHFNFELKETEPDLYTCDICLKSFPKLKSIIQHLENHSGRFHCIECNKIFGRHENLKSHSCQKVLKEKCVQCEKAFPQKKYLLKHIRSVHEKEFTCRICDKSFCSNSELNIHVCPKIPEEKRKKFKCNTCYKIFFKDKSLRKHLETHRSKDEKVAKSKDSYICAVCSVVLKSKRYYMRHLKIHEGTTVKCDKCDKKFSRSDVLKEHKKMVHSTEHKVKCTVCNKEIKTKKLLMIHMQVHSEPTSKCAQCGTVFKQKSNLIRHIKSVHNRNVVNIFSEGFEVFDCPFCAKKLKLKNSLTRHIKNQHPQEFEIYQHTNAASRKVKLTKNGIIQESDLDKSIDTDQKCRDLKETIENMDFTMDVNTNNDLNIENILNGSETIDKFLKESSDTIVGIPAGGNVSKENVADGELNNENKEVCLSMPDLNDGEQEIKLDNNAYIMENGTIVQPQEDPSNVVVYILNETSI